MATIEAFETYERQYHDVCASLARRCTTAAAAFQGRYTSKEIKSDVDGAQAMIRKMDSETRGLQPSVRAGLLAKLEKYKSDLNILNGTLKGTYSGYAQEGLREELLESGMADILGVSADQKSRLLIATEKQNQTTDKLKDCRGTLLHAEGVGVSILHDLHQQRQSLLHAHDILHKVDDNVDKSRRIIGAMVRRMDRNNWIISLIITLHVLVFLAILYFKFVH